MVTVDVKMWSEYILPVIDSAEFCVQRSTKHTPYTCAGLRNNYFGRGHPLEASTPLPRWREAPGTAPPEGQNSQPPEQLQLMQPSGGRHFFTQPSTGRPSLQRDSFSTLQRPSACLTLWRAAPGRNPSATKPRHPSGGNSDRISSGGSGGL